MRILSFLLFILLILAVNRAAFPDLDHGDEFTDANVLNAGKNFAKFGFAKTHFLPFFEPNLAKLDKPYTHMPPLPEIINGIIRMFLRTDSLYIFRSFSLFLSMFTILFWYLMIKKAAHSAAISFLSALFFLTNPMFIFGMDSLQELAYSEFLRSCILLVFTIYVWSARQKKMLLACLWMLILVQTFTTLEYVIYFPLFFILFRIFFPQSRKALSLRMVVILFSAQAVGVIAHFIQNALYFKSFVLAFNDLRDITLASVSHRPDMSLSLNLTAWIQYVLLRNLSLVLPFSYSNLFLGVLFAVLIHSVLPEESKDKIKPIFFIFLIFFISGISWYVVMPSHSLAHAFVNFLARHLVPAAAIGFALFFYIIFSFIKEHTGNNLYLRALCVGMVFIIAMTGIRKSQLPVTAENLKASQDFLTFKQCLLKLKEASRENDEIGLNYYRYPFIRYYADRHCIAVFDRNSLEAISTLPRYFIFFPYNSKGANELLQLLTEKYSPLWECNSQRFPALFLQLNNS